MESLELQRRLEFSAGIFFFLLTNWGLNSGPCACKAGALLFSATPPVHFAQVILEMGSLNYWPGLA
jgi:hypothetical protein